MFPLKQLWQQSAVDRTVIQSHSHHPGTKLRFRRPIWGRNIDLKWRNFRCTSRNLDESTIRHAFQGKTTTSSTYSGPKERLESTLFDQKRPLHLKRHLQQKGNFEGDAATIKKGSIVQIFNFWAPNYATLLILAVQKHRRILQKISPFHYESRTVQVQIYKFEISIH